MGCREYLITQSKQRLTQRTWYIQIRKVIQSFGSFRRLNFLGNQKEGKLNKFKKEKERKRKIPWSKAMVKKKRVEGAIMHEKRRNSFAAMTNRKQWQVEKEEWGGATSTTRNRSKHSQLFNSEKQSQPLEFPGMKTKVSFYLEAAKCARDCDKWHQFSG